MELKYYTNPRSKIVFDYLKSLTNLSKLELSNMNLTNLDISDFTNFSNLKNINLNNNKLNNIIFPELPSIETLYINDNYLLEIPKSISNLRNLTLLSCGENKFNKLSNSLEHLTNLKKLYYIQRLNSISEIEIDNNFLNLKNLCELNINTNGFLFINNISFSEFIFLTKINLSNNNLSVMPEFNINLKYLVLTNNKFNDLNLNKYTNLNLLCLNNNCIRYFPEVDKCIKLVHIGLNNNIIQKIPEYIRKFKLLYLDLSFNQIEHIPKIFKRVNYKQTYHFYKNYIKTIDDSICLLSNNLGELTISDNPIAKLRTRTIVQNATLNYVKKFNNFYYIQKYGKRLEYFYIKKVRNKNINLELLYSPDLKFYLQFVPKEVLDLFKK